VTKKLVGLLLFTVFNGLISLTLPFLKDGKHIIILPFHAKAQKFVPGTKMSSKKLKF
jgi:hypothetical protein